jgi:hypothetical protein
MGKTKKIREKRTKNGENRTKKGGKTSKNP